MKPQFKDIADHAVLVTFADEISEDAHALVIALDTAISKAPPKGLIETVPALVNLLVEFDPVEADHAAVKTSIQANLESMVVQDLAGVLRTVHVCYEAPFAQDLEAVASATGLSTDAVINAHLKGDFTVLMYGFAPGYAYLSGVPEQIQVPRKTVPVRDVAAGSVIIAGPQCLVTTLTMPTGWSIIGRSPTPILTGDQERPFLFDVGDRVAFKRVSLAAFEHLEKEQAYA